MTDHSSADQPADGPRRRKRAQTSAPTSKPTPSETSPGAGPSTAGDTPPERGRGPSQAQLRQLYLFRLKGLSQTEIGRRLGRSERTIRNWVQKLDPAKLGFEQAYSPLAALNRELAQLAVDAQQYRTWMRRAEADGDLKLAAQMLERAGRVDRERQRLLADLNVYDAVRPQMPHAQDSASAERADWLSLLDLDADPGPEEASNDNAD